MRTAMVAVLIAAVTGTPFGCKEKSDSASVGRPAAAQIPATLFASAAPEGVLELKPAKDNAKEGDVVSFRAKVGGSVDPFTEGRAIFTVVDLSIVSCDQMGEDDHCATPWDYCCEPKKNLFAHSATIQVVGDDGAPIKADLNGVEGLKPLAEVCIVGKVIKRDDAGQFVVNATSLFIKAPDAASPAGG